VADNPKTILAPILPHTAQKLHEYLGYDGHPFGFAQDRLFGTQHVVEYEEGTRSHQALTYDHTGAIGTGAKSELPPGQALREPAPLFKKLDESVIEEEYARLALQLSSKRRHGVLVHPEGRGIHPGSSKICRIGVCTAKRIVVECRQAAKSV
jgi:hypothetical protein